MDDPEEVLAFWFGETAHELADKQRMWWGGGDRDAVDREIADRFGETLRAAARGELEHWRRAARSRLALVVVLDQFSRHVHRGEPGAFAQDPRAREVVLEGLEQGHDRELEVPERLFFYMPLMHAEAPGIQERSVACFDALRREAPERHRQLAETSYRHAEEHRDVVARFGRFPHRNRILGREPTEAERTFLDAEGRSYGQ